MLDSYHWRLDRVEKLNPGYPMIKNRPEDPKQK